MQNFLTNEALRLDIWLWAARFYKTRSLAKAAIEKGQVLINNQKPKVSRKVEAGLLLVITQGHTKKEVEVLALANKRGPATFAQQLYQETPASLAARAKEEQLRQASHLSQPALPNKPSARNKRQLQQIKRQEL